MPRQTFFTRLFLVIFGTAAALFALHQIPVFQKHWAVSLGAVALFSAISVGLFFFGEMTALSKNKLAFNGLITGSVLGKIMLSLVGLLIYFKTQKPPDRLFVVPFIAVYIIFTIFETWFLLRLAKTKSIN